MSDGADRRDQRAKRFQAGTVSYLCCTGATLPDNSRVYISIEKCLYLFTRLLLLFLPYGPVPVVYVLDNQILLGRRKKTLENRRLGTIVVVLLRNLILLFCLVFFLMDFRAVWYEKKNLWTEILVFATFLSCLNMKPCHRHHGALCIGQEACESPGCIFYRHAFQQVCVCEARGTRTGAW